MSKEYHDLIKATLTHLKETPHIFSEDPSLIEYFHTKEKATPPPISPIPSKKAEKAPLAKPKTFSPTYEKKLVSKAVAPKTSEKPKEQKPQSFPIAIESLPDLSEDTFEDLRKNFREKTPHLFLHKAIPSDQKATAVRGAWKYKTNIPDVPILLTGQFRQCFPFLNEIAKAIRTTFTSSGVINLSEVEKENRWETFLSAQNLKLIIIPDMLLWTTPHLLSCYKEEPGNTMRKLGSVPVLLLPDLSLYRKDPLLKRSLWNVICQMLT